MLDVAVADVEVTLPLGMTASQPGRIEWNGFAIKAMGKACKEESNDSVGL